jgi:hypothetical protein
MSERQDKRHVKRHVKRLITDRDVQTGAVRPPLVLDADTLITPSARDRAVRLGWAIVEPGAPVPSGGGCGGECARCGRVGCAGSCGAAGGTAAPGLDALADGLYLVRIEGGRRVAVLPAAGPGLLLRATAPGAAR